MLGADEDFPTQVIPTLDNKKIEDKIKEQDSRNKKKKNFFQAHKGLTIALILVLLFTLSFAGITLLFNGSKSKDVQIPNLVGLTEEEIKDTLKGSKITYKISEEKYNENVESGRIISQKPEFKNDYKIKENTVIEVVISLGQKIVKVPKVVGLKEQEARSALEAEDLEVEVEEEFNKKVEEGYVISQDVENNTEVAAGSTVKIKVSKGIEKVDVPNVVGRTKEEALKMLKENDKFEVTEITEQDTTKADGTILRQSLDAGTTVEKGAKITITINQIEKIVDATATINLKSILNYTPQTNSSNTNSGNYGAGNTNTSTKADEAQVKLVVGEDTVYNKKHKKSETNIKVNFSGLGTVDVKLYVDDILQSRKQVNLSETNTVVFE
ncbi:MAG: PASTA domain-containing protein [Clostridia bacterium]|nr:PASTA domain-containing protein [Clostridia bacterium]